MSEKFEMSMMSELRLFLGLQIKQTKEGTFASQAKYTKDLFKKFNMQESKGMKTPMPTSGHLDLTKDGKPVNQKVSLYDWFIVISMCIPSQYHAKCVHVCTISSSPQRM